MKWAFLVLLIGISATSCITQKVLVITGNEPDIRQDTDTDRILGTVIKREIEGQTDETNFVIERDPGDPDGVRAGDESE